MKKPLKDALRDEIESYDLSGSQYARLEKLLAQSGSAARSGSGSAIRRTAALASLAVVLLASVVWWQGRYPVDGADLVQDIAAEVAVNHIKLKPADFSGSSIGELKPHFDQLDFVPIDSRLVAGEVWRVTGGRYCSIQGKSAAQIRLQRDESADAPGTLYQAVYDPDRHGLIPDITAGAEPMLRYAHGVKVQLWVERGLLFALVSG